MQIRSIIIAQLQYVLIWEQKRLTDCNWKKDNDNWKVRIISFNYTKSLEKLIAFNNERFVIETMNGHQRYIDAVEHIHGFTNDRMILGVNDSTQIKNQSLMDCKPLPYNGELYSDEHRRKFKTNDVTAKVGTNNGKLILAIDGLHIGEWFKKQFERLQQNVGLKPIQKKNKGFKL